MINNNNNVNLIVKENYKKVEEIREVDTEIPTYEEFMKNYKVDDKVNYDDLSVSGGNVGEVKGYGPCSGSDCNCSCSMRNCSCKAKIETEFYKEGNLRMGACESSAKGKIGWDGASLGTKHSMSLFREKSGSEEISWLSPSVGGKVELSGDGLDGEFEAGMEFVGFKDESKKFEARLRPNIDTGVSINGNGVKVKAAGFGFSANDEQVGISLPIGEIKIDKDDCVIQ